MSLDSFLNVASLRAENELEAMMSSSTQSSVLSRWERKSLKTKSDSDASSSSASSADRFIPSRSVNRDLQLCNLQNDSMSENVNNNHNAELPSAQLLKEQIFESAEQSSKILAFKDKPKAADSSYLNHMRVLYTQNKSNAAAPKQKFRAIAQQAERILDAPDMSDDFYLNLLDWSAQNVLAVALGASVYLWNAQSGNIDLLTELEGADNMVTSLAWSADGSFLSIGANADNTVQLWQVEAKKQLRTMRGHASRVGALAWNQHILSSGSRDGSIFHHDVRVAQHHVGTLRGHSLEVCGLKWSHDGTELASGGNDNIVNIWDAASTGASAHHQAPRFTFAQHTAAVKALAWCPYQRHVLATGAGTADRHIRLFNTQTGAMTQAVDTESQVCSLQWGRHEKELVSAHGFSQNQLSVWRAPSSGGALTKMADLTGHSARILHTTMSPDGTTICSAGADETLRFWKVWDAPATKKSSVGAAAAAASSNTASSSSARPLLR